MMPVRGTSVARHSKYAIVVEQADREFEGERIWCAWSDCDRYGYMCHQFVVNEAKPGFPVKLARYLFCSEQHEYYFRRSHIPGEYGKLAGRLRGRYL
jgi:hypothetical protein